jgi:hypothetical protein
MDRHYLGAALVGGLTVVFYQTVLIGYIRMFETLLSRRKAKENESKTILHHGSCHCRRVKFGIRVPKRLNQMKTSSKMSFPRVQVSLQSFELFSDQSVMSLYTHGNLSQSKDSAGGVLAFCSFCGMHVLYSLASEPDEVEVNIDCIKKSSSRELLSEVNVSPEVQSVIREASWNRRGLGAFCSPHLSPGAVQSAMYENIYNTSYYGGPNSASHEEPSFEAKTQVRHEKHRNFNQSPEGFKASTSLDKWRQDIDSSRDRLLEQMEWTQMYASQKSVEKQYPIVEKEKEKEKDSAAFSSPLKENMTERAWSTSVTTAVTISSAECSLTDCSRLNSDADSSTSTVSEDEDTISVLSSRITSEGDLSSAKTSAIKPSSHSHRDSVSLFDSPNVDLESVAMDSPHRMHHQLKQHLSHHINKSKSQI